MEQGKRNRVSGNIVLVFYNYLVSSFNVTSESLHFVSITVVTGHYMYGTFQLSSKNTVIMFFSKLKTANKTVAKIFHVL